MIAFLDIGSTLIDGPASGPGKRIAMELGLGDEAVSAMNEILFQTDARESEELAARVAQRFGAGAGRASDVVRQIWEAQFDESYVLPGAKEAIESLRAAGIGRVYVSNIWRPFHARFEAEFPLEAGAQPCFLSFRTRRMKPSAELLGAICSEIDVAPNDVVMVGDTWAADIEPAIRSGMGTIWILHRPDKEKADLIRVLNGTSAAPDVTLGGIGDLTADTVHRAYGLHMRRVRD
ncbi:MAG: HAD hydrolase-like protein [Acidobacteriaceae bacterium]|nr:HAD hydrolase-like protein [Acidobacteriaceae bacterium]